MLNENEKKSKNNQFNVTWQRERVETFQAL